MHPYKRNSRPTSFRAYVDFEDFRERPIDVPEEVEDGTVEPDLLPGEIVIAVANNVLKFAPLKANKTGISGTLFVTNFKVSFVTSLPVETKETALQERSLQSRYLGPHDFCLSEVDLVYQISEGSSRKKRLLYNTPLPSRLAGLQVVLKNLRVINFSFKFTPTGDELRVAQALLHHAFPTTVDRLFLSCGHPTPHTGVPEFCLAQDWEKELQRTRCPNWRVSKHNEFFNLCSSLPTVVVVPWELLDGQLEHAAQHFQGTRPPVWCWGVHAGAALVRMAQTSPNISHKQQENRMMGLVHKCHPKKLQPTILDLDQLLPSQRDINLAYSKLRDLHTPDDATQFWEQDRHYLSRWENSRWLSHVSKCLEVSQSAATSIARHNSSVILQESEGRDLSAVISSLVQLLLDPYARTLRGFHALLQKDWVALGHPFSTRLGHTRNQAEEQSPVWLLFLDCVHQVSLQHPSAFEFSAHYLVSLWHASHCSLHSSFMFNSISAKYSAAGVLQRENPQQPVFLKPVWAWWADDTGQGNGEQNGTKIEKEEMEERHVRKKKWEVRSAFLNVHYIQTLMESLSISGALGRLRDPVSSAHHTWHRLCRLMGDCGSLPYDPSLPVSTVNLDPSLRLDTSLPALKPWRECFSGWIAEPALTIMEIDSLSRHSTTERHHWEHICDIYRNLKDHLEQTLANGSVEG